VAASCCWPPGWLATLCDRSTTAACRPPSSLTGSGGCAAFARAACHVRQPSLLRLTALGWRCQGRLLPPHSTCCRWMLAPGLCQCCLAAARAKAAARCCCAGLQGLHSQCQPASCVLNPARLLRCCAPGSCPATRPARGGAWPAAAARRLAARWAGTCHAWQQSDGGLVKHTVAGKTPRGAAASVVVSGQLTPAHLAVSLSDRSAASAVTRLVTQPPHVAASASMRCISARVSLAAPRACRALPVG
jgi:hypothetical protein